MYATLQTLTLTPKQRAICRFWVQRKAYFKWLKAGRPKGRASEFWLEAEREFIEEGGMRS